MATIVLINPYPYYATGSNTAVTTPPMGLTYIAASLERDGHTVKIIDAYILKLLPNDIGHKCLAADIIGISINILTYKTAIESAKHIKSHLPHIPIILGGPYSSQSLAEYTLAQYQQIDAMVIGEGERTLCEIVDRLRESNIFEDVKGVSYKCDRQSVIHNEARPLIENLDELPAPAYHLLPPLKQYKTRSRKTPVGYILTSRGCTSPCSFCNRNTFGTSWRPHTPTRVLQDIATLVERYHVRQLNILDDNFTFDYARAEEILDYIARRFTLSIDCYAGIRIDKTDEALLQKMKKAGVFKVAFGIESASLCIQKRIHKFIDLEKARHLTAVARSLGMVTYAFFMIGLPGDTKETMQETIDFAVRMNPHFANFMICIPFPGTALYKEITEREDGKFCIDTDHGLSSGFFEPNAFFSFKNMNTEDIVSFYKSAWKTFYARPTKLLDVIGSIRSFSEAQWLSRIVRDMI